MDWATPWHLLFALLIGHVLADFVLQTDVMAQAKNRHNSTYVNPDVMPSWPYWMSAHSMIHAGIVWAITGNEVLGLAEFINHWWTDTMKCEKKFGPHADQFIHILTKVGYVLIIMWGPR